MDNKKIAALLFKIQMDDIKDADMLADYAEEMIESGDNSTAELLAQRAKSRLQQMTECDKYINNIIQRMAVESPEEMASFSDDNIYSIMYKDYLGTWTEKIKLKLSGM